MQFTPFLCFLLFPLSRKDLVVNTKFLTIQLVNLFCIPLWVCRVSIYCIHYISCSIYFSLEHSLSLPRCVTHLTLISLSRPTHTYGTTPPDTLMLWRMTCNFTLKNLLALWRLCTSKHTILFFFFILFTYNDHQRGLESAFHSVTGRLSHQHNDFHKHLVNWKAVDRNKQPHTVLFKQERFLLHMQIYTCAHTQSFVTAHLAFPWRLSVPRHWRPWTPTTPTQMSHNACVWASPVSFAAAKHPSHCYVFF